MLNAGLLAVALTEGFFTSTLSHVHVERRASCPRFGTFFFIAIFAPEYTLVSIQMQGRDEFPLFQARDAAFEVWPSSEQSMSGIY